MMAHGKTESRLTCAGQAAHLGADYSFKAKDMDAITRILQDYSAKQVKKASVEKTSVLEKLKKFKEIVAAIPRKVAEKKKERSR